MFTPRFPQISSPVLVVDLGIFTMRALLYVPGAGPQEQYGFLLPSPECALNERIHGCTVNRRPLHMVGVCMGLTPVAALHAHLEAGLEVSMHPKTAAAMTADPARLAALGIDVRNTMAGNVSHVQALDFDAYFWNTLCDMAELPRPETTLVSAADYGRPLDFDPVRGRSHILKDFFAGWPGPRDLSVRKLPDPNYRRSLPRISAIHENAGVPAMDFATAFIFGMLSLPEVEQTSRKGDVLLLHVGEHFMEASLVCDNHLLGFLELPFRGLFAENGIEKNRDQVLLTILNDYYQGAVDEAWAMERGGYLWLAPGRDLPGKALCPVYSSGRGAAVFEKHSKVMGLEMDSVMINCWGLLNAYNRNLAHGRA